MRTIIVGLLLVSGCVMSTSGRDFAAGDGAKGMPGPSNGSGQGKPGQLTAGDYDDNKNFEWLQTSLDDLFAPLVKKGSLPVADRVTVTVTDGAGRPLSNARVDVRAGAAMRASLPTGTDGRVLLFPALDGFAGQGDLTVAITSAAGTHAYAAPAGSAWTFAIPDAAHAETTALDLAFVVDATGSMTDEIEYLKTEMQDIAQRVAERYPGASLRYALIVYRDQGDEYVVRSFPFDSLASFEADLAQQSAGGGGDYPEAAEAAMGAAMELGWRDGNVARVLFHVADAPPHDDNYEPFLASAKAARARGIRIFPVGASGVALEAEYLMRLSALVTLGRYVFLTDDSGIGNAHEPPHIPCYQVQHLNDLLVREIASEIAGSYIAAPPDEVLRTVGNYESGVCTEPATEALTRVVRRRAR